MNIDISYAAELLIKGIEKIAPDYYDIKKQVTELRRKYPSDSRRRLAERFARRARRRYEVTGAVSALPGLIPGTGTAAQIAIEAATILGDIPYMVRQFAEVLQGVCIIYGEDSGRFETELFMRVLGYWCKALKFVRKSLVTQSAECAGKIVGKHVSREMVKRVNHLVGMTVVTKYGTKRGFLSLGRTIPLGVGVGVGAAFNFGTMHGYNKACISYFETKSNSQGEDEFQLAA